MLILDSYARKEDNIKILAKIMNVKIVFSKYLA